MYTTSLITAILSVSSLANADFFISNSTTCMGAFPLQSCKPGPNVFSGMSNVTDYTCSKLQSAMDHLYVYNGTAGPTGSPDLWVKKLCGAGDVHFQKQYATDGKDAGYLGKDGSGKDVATCVLEESQLSQHCSMWVGAFFFETEYMCTSDTITCS